MTRQIFGIALLLMFFSLSNTTATAQGQTQKSKGHYQAGLDFFGTWGNGTIPHTNPALNGLYAADGWVSGTSNGKAVKMKGLLNAAVLKVDWTTLVGEPIENYQFVWKSSGQYDIQYTNSKGQPKLQTITRSQLQKYPDLLKRFDNLAPSNIDFVIEWRIGDQSDADREAYLKKYGLMSSIGSSHPHVKAGFKTTVKGAHLLFDPAGKQPYNVPYSPAGGWAEFLGLPKEYDKTKLTHIKDYFKMSYGQIITNFKAIKVEWNWGELTAIAEKFESYEKGETEPTPKEQIEKENQKAVAAYAKNDEWAEAYEKENEELIVFSEFKINNQTRHSEQFSGAKNKKGDWVIPMQPGYVFNLSKEYGLMILSIAYNGALKRNGTIIIYNTKGKELKRIENCNDFHLVNNLAIIKMPFVLYHLTNPYEDQFYVINILMDKTVFSTKEIDNNFKFNSFSELNVFYRDSIGSVMHYYCSKSNYINANPKKIIGDFYNEQILNGRNAINTDINKKYKCIVTFKNNSYKLVEYYYGITQDDEWEFIKKIDY